jgi:hypothetical protein
MDRFKTNGLFEFPTTAPAFAGEVLFRVLQTERLPRLYPPGAL